MDRTIMEAMPPNLKKSVDFLSLGDRLFNESKNKTGFKETLFLLASLIAVCMAGLFAKTVKVESKRMKDYKNKVHKCQKCSGSGKIRDILQARIPENATVREIQEAPSPSYIYVVCGACKGQRYSVDD